MPLPLPDRPLSVTTTSEGDPTAFPTLISPKKPHQRTEEGCKAHSVPPRSSTRLQAASCTCFWAHVDVSQCLWPGGSCTAPSKGRQGLLAGTWSGPQMFSRASSCSLTPKDRWRLYGAEWWHVSNTTRVGRFTVPRFITKSIKKEKSVPYLPYNNDNRRALCCMSKKTWFHMCEIFIT